MSFQAAAEYAKERATELKGRWRQITSEPWGAKKGGEWFAVVEGEEWSAEIGVPPPANLGDSRQTVAHLEGQLAGLDGQIGVARREQATTVQRAAREREAKEQTARVQQRIAELREIVAGEEAGKNMQQAAQKAVRDAEAALRTVPLPSVVQGEGSQYAYLCEGCGRITVLVPDPTGAIRLGLQQLVEPTQEVSEEHAVAEADLAEARRKLEETGTKLRGIETARRVLDELLATQAQPADAPEAVKEEEDGQGVFVHFKDGVLTEVEEPPQPSLFTLEANRQKLATRLTAARLDVREAEDHQQRVVQANQRTADAAALHAEIETWLRLAEDLGPEGIPAQLLHSAIDPINEGLAQSGFALGFMSLALTPEMEMLGRPEENDPETPRRYELLSESARWRVEAALADAIGVAAESWWYSGSCQPSESMPIILDRFDVLDGPNRGRAIRWLLSLGRQVILLGTLRNRDVPQEVPSGMEVKWLQAGALMGAVE